MPKTVTLTHHAEKPEYSWEIVVPEGPTVLLKDEGIRQALEMLGLRASDEVAQQILELPNGGSRSVDAEVNEAELKALAKSEGLRVRE